MTVEVENRIRDPRNRIRIASNRIRIRIQFAAGARPSDPVFDLQILFFTERKGDLCNRCNRLCPISRSTPYRYYSVIFSTYRICNQVTDFFDPYAYRRLLEQDPDPRSPPVYTWAECEKSHTTLTSAPNAA